MAAWPKEQSCFALNIRIFHKFVNTGILNITVLICTKIKHHIVILLIWFQRNLKRNGLSFILTS